MSDHREEEDMRKYWLGGIAAVLLGGTALAADEGVFQDRRPSTTFLDAFGGSETAQPAPDNPSEVQVAEPSAAADARYRVIGVGDIMMGSDWPQPYMDERLTPGASPASVFGEDLAGLLASGDITFGNFEGTLHESSEGAKYCRNPAVCYTFRSPPFHADFLKDAGFTLVSNANNHARDFAENGRKLTYDNLARTGMAVSGGDQDGMRFGVQALEDGRTAVLVAFGHNPGLMQVGDLDRVSSLVREADELGDIVVVSCHIGAEGAKYDRVTRAKEMFLNEDRGNPYAFAHTAVDAGADIVLCHGPHIPRAVEIYKDRFIAYSLGNFYTFGRFNLRDVNGQVPIADLVVDGEGRVKEARIVSARQDRPGRPYLDPTNAAADTTARLTARDFPEAGITFAPDGTLSW